MTGRRGLILGGSLMGGSLAMSQGLAFLRNIIIARFLSQDDMGIAAVFAMAITFLEMLTELNAGMLLTQAKDGDEPRFQATVHAINVARGLLLSAVLFLLAQPVAWLFSVPETAWAFRWLAVVPLLRNLFHADLNRLQRHMRFAPAASTEVTSQLISVVVAWPLAAYLRDYSAVLWILVIQAAAWTLMTHLLAERRFELGWDTTSAQRVFQFGWPMLLNCLLMFAILQGDRVVIGLAEKIFPDSAYRMSDLGVYFIALTFSTIPISIPVKAGGSVLLPALARVQNDLPAFTRKYTAIVQVYTALGTALALPLIAAGGWLASLFYGQSYQVAGPALLWLAAMQSLRMIRSAVNLACVARGDSKSPLLGNSVRLLALPGVLAVASCGKPIAWIAAVGCATELLAVIFATIILQRRHDVPASVHAGPIVASCATMAATAALCRGLDAGPVLALVTALGMATMMLCYMFMCMAEFRSQVRDLAGTFRKK